MSALLGKKVGMTQVFTDKGDCVPVTVVHVERCIPVLKRTAEKDGYQSVMLAYGDRKAKHTNKPLKGFYDKHNVGPAKILKEFRDQDVDDDAIGKPVGVDVFSEGDEVEVVGVLCFSIPISQHDRFIPIFLISSFQNRDTSLNMHHGYRHTIALIRKHLGHTYFFS